VQEQSVNGSGPAVALVEVDVCKWILTVILEEREGFLAPFTMTS
jgi:hypothetical protein